MVNYIKMGKHLVIVESPTKAKTMTRFLPKEYTIIASVGHVRDLPQSAAAIPKKYREEEWSRLGVNVDNNFEPLYVVAQGKSKIIQEIKRAMQTAEDIVLATDEDREGESISWHLLEVLKPKIPIYRMVFHEITKSAINESLKNFRQIDMQLVKAQETRRILDRLFGYTLSPLIWKKITFGLSAGRVQSPGLRMLVDRERARMTFTSTAYWDLLATLTGPQAPEDPFPARLVELDGKRLVTSKDFDSQTGKRVNDKNVLLTGSQCKKLGEQLKQVPWTIESIVEKDNKAHPSIPFTTSTLQQAANRKLGLSTRDTMRVAQHLYESGKITYMRTDSPHLSNEATEAARDSVVKLAGKDYLTDAPRYFRGGRGEAHEAIRPAGKDWATPQASGLSGRYLQLYRMIWQRTIATQMKPAIKRGMKVRIAAGNARFEATGLRIIFLGYMRAYFTDISKVGAGKPAPAATAADGAGAADKPDAPTAADAPERILPPLQEGDTCTPQAITPEAHHTRPPSRFSEAALIQRLEAEGIGRPSTYASIISTLYDRGYARKTNGALVPTLTGIAVIQLLERHFSKYIDYGFTAGMEQVLDEIARGEGDWLKYLQQFYLSNDGLKQSVGAKDSEIDAESTRKINIPMLNDRYQVRIGRYGPYIIYRDPDAPPAPAPAAKKPAAAAKKPPAGKKKEDDGAVHVSIPEECAPADLKSDYVDELITTQNKGPSPLGTDPATGKPVYLLTGRYGPYVQLGEVEEGSDEKPRRASVTKEHKASELTLETALQLLSLPRTLGQHPETGKDVIANRGRFGPYLIHDTDTRSLKKDDNVYTITLERALAVLAQPKATRRGAPQVLKQLGKSKKGKTVTLHSGRYGPYLKVGTKNISLPAELSKPEKLSELTLEMVESLL